MHRYAGCQVISSSDKVNQSFNPESRSSSERLFRAGLVILRSLRGAGSTPHQHTAG